MRTPARKLQATPHQVSRNPVLHRLMFFLLALCLTGLFTSAHAQTERVVFDRVNVIPMDAERVLRNQRVVIADGVIQALGSVDVIAIPDGFRIIDGNGGYLLPGLAEMHAHVPADQDDAEFLERVLFLYVANGVTTARSMLGAGWHVGLQEQIASHERLGPRLYTAGPGLSTATVPNPQRAREVVREQHAAGHDFMKLFSMTTEVFDAMAETAHELGLPFAGHVPPQVGLEHAMAGGTATVDHLDGYLQVIAADAPSNAQAGFFGYGLTDWVDESRIVEIARATRDAGTWVVPTETLMVNILSATSTEEFAARPDMAYMPEETVQAWSQSRRNFVSGDDWDADRAQRFLDIRAQLLRTLHEVGAGILLGSDAPQVFNVPGFSIHDEMRLMHEAGMPIWDVLYSGTAAPAVFFGHEDRFGRVAPGLDADLILVADNPLQDLSALATPRGVMVRGRWLDRATLDEGLARWRRD